MQSEEETPEQRRAFSANGIAVFVKKQINLIVDVVKSELSLGPDRYGTSSNWGKFQGIPRAL